MNPFINRAIRKQFLDRLLPNKVLVLLGARRVGKTLFLKNIAGNDFSEPYLWMNGEDLVARSQLAVRSVEHYRSLVGHHKILIIDEAQKVPYIGLILKLMVDHLEGLKIIATGSSVFDLSNKLGEPLTGRKYTFYLYPFAQMELTPYENRIETRARLEERLVYGTYPELTGLQGLTAKAEYLFELVNAYLLKDILEFDGVRNSDKLVKLLRLIAYQTGKEVSLEELGRQLGLSRNTVEKYLDLLSKVFVIYRISGFSRNLRSEISKSHRWYFYDNGIRNALINNFNPLSIRNDMGELWESYVLTERIKYQQYTGKHTNNYFWRTYQQQEIDWIEESSGRIEAYEVKWNPGKNSKPPSAWRTSYPESSFRMITPENYLEWVE
ncbi:MAG TPA: ATP-binding protein [Bacteroidales bacterium]|nr:ATP-binding protein [Bacteroidales bacterium]HRZ49064.1 ATP-binding protein [Bacteroidales bacterium]